MSPRDEPNERFVVLIQEHQRILGRICEAFAPTREDREDLYQEILLQAWRAFGSFAGRSKFSTWLYRVALNTALMRRRRDLRRRDTLPITPETLEVVANPSVSPRSDVDLLDECIRQLPEVDRAVVLLHLEGSDYAEISEVTGLSRGNVSVRLVRIKGRLRKLLIARGYPEESSKGMRP